MEDEAEPPEEPRPVPTSRTRQTPPVVRGNPNGPPVRLLTRAEIDEAMLG